MVLLVPKQECSFPSAPAGNKAQGSDARRGHALNRRFEAHERADGSQALRTATASLPGMAWLLSTLPTHVLKLFVGCKTLGFFGGR